jgi:hypothetical protein
MNDELSSLVKAHIQAVRAYGDTKFNHPYVGDLIATLNGYPNGRPRRRVLEVMERERSDLLLPVPPRFEEAVQAAYNRHSANSYVFRSQRLPDEKPLFFSLGGKGSGTWAVDEQAAIAWLRVHIPPLFDPLAAEEPA